MIRRASSRGVRPSAAVGIYFTLAGALVLGVAAYATLDAIHEESVNLRTRKIAAWHLRPSIDDAVIFNP